VGIVTYTESCCCGATLTISGWGIREIGEPVLSFRQAHATHLAVRGGFRPRTPREIDPRSKASNVVPSGGRRPRPE
jgi:hypothetical protein